MQDYDWRKEREKYRPDFMKQPESEQESPEQQEPEQQESEQQESAPQAPEQNTPTSATVSQQQSTAAKRSYFGWIVAALIAVVLLVIVLAIAVKQSGSNSSENKGGDTVTMLADSAEQNKKAVGLIVLTAELQNGNKFPLPIATAWAFAPNKFATNAHVANGLKTACSELKASLTDRLLKKKADDAGFKNNVDTYLKRIGETQGKKITEQCREEAQKLIKGFTVSILINGTSHESYSVTHVQLHRGFSSASGSFFPDVAVLTIEGKHDVLFKIAEDQTLSSIKSGDPIAFLGFPMENVHNDNVNLDNPVASMQSGIVVAVSDFDLKDAGPLKNYLIRHNLPSAGGASGSPIFNPYGEVVALLFAGNTIGQVQKGQVERTPSAVQINYAVRVDLLKDLAEPVEIQKHIENK
jgi:hypothetical protein